MKTELTKNELTMILESLNYSIKSIEEYDKYPSYEFKQQRIKEVNNLIFKIKQMMNEIH